jgi:transcriptional regulator with XRE-family HTH domain
MKAKSEKRLLAEQLRTEQGYSYNEISQQIGVSKSTLSHWLKHISLTLEQEERIQQRIEDNQTAFIAQARKSNQKRFKHAREQAFQTGVEIASLIPENDIVHELALAMLYLGEGDKTGNRVQIANTDPVVLQYFLWAVEKLYQIDRAEMTLRLNLVEAARPYENQMKQWWAEQLHCTISQFIKSQFDKRSQSQKLTGDYHGVCTITYNDTYLYERLVGVYSSYVGGQEK